MAVLSLFLIYSKAKKILVAVEVNESCARSLRRNHSCFQRTQSREEEKVSNGEPVFVTTLEIAQQSLASS